MKSDSFEYIFQTIKDTINVKNDQYRSNPIDIIPLDDLFAQLNIKVIRARESLTEERCIDELTDVITYAMLIWDKMQRESKSYSYKQSSIDDYVGSVTLCGTHSSNCQLSNVK